MFEAISCLFTLNTVFTQLGVQNSQWVRFKYFDYKAYEDTKQVIQAKIFVPKFEIQANYNFSETMPEAGLNDLFDESTLEG